MFARSGIANAAFAIKEIKEICALPNLDVYTLKSEVDASMTDATKEEIKSQRGVKRRTEFLLDRATQIESVE